MRSFVLPLALVVIAASPAAGQDAERYQLERTEDGYVRLDTRTGAMSRCQESGTELICRPALEERSGAAGEATGRQDEAPSRDQAGRRDEPGRVEPGRDEELNQLRETVEALQQRVEALEAAKPVAVLPTEQEFERTMDYAERFLRRFMGVVQDLDEKKPDTSTEPAPNRT